MKHSLPASLHARDILFIAAGIVTLFISRPSAVHAEIVVHLHSVTVLVGTQTFTGYLVLPYKEDLDLPSQEGLDYVRGLGNDPQLYESIERAFLFSKDLGMFKFTTKNPTVITRDKVRKIIPLNWELDDTEPGAIATVTPDEGKLLKAEPIAWCKSQVSDGDFWISYNPKVTNKELDSLCNRDYAHPPSDAEQQAILKPGKVVHFTYPAY